MTEASVSFAGNLTDQPELRHTEAGIARAMVRVAVSGRREQEPSFFAVVVWRDQAEHVAESLAKGSRVVVVGRLQQGAWTAEDGSARQVVEVVRDHLEEIRDETGYPVSAGVADEIASLVERLR
jgi:single-strand DNA-binding protein